ncbi:sialic acid-binding Ig-like lectin 5 [Notolabrus celidotus]|uniref:sialic acid-binding Ig-like lectin 5 n=1 Tax=Notolabrus celidotus TaxID=1203425 RepID=UPI00148FF08C|nr:sialic acid-binding Ig-like lectin 5 [Notolabrus celidotus]
MFVLIVAALLFPVWGSTSDSGSSAKKGECLLRNYCTTLSEGEITAEAGLCVVIPCSFTTDSDFTATKIIWYKCERPKTKCDPSDVIFSSTEPNNGFKSGFEGRVSLLESDVRKKNCSIIIKDLRKSDSGSYQLRVESTTKNGFTFDRKANISVKDLTQKPTVTIPSLTEGQKTTLSCTAPGLCSGSVPEITWMWREGENDSHITGNISAVKTDNLRHSSTLTLTPSAKRHGTEIICKVNFKNSISTEKTETLKVTYVKDPVITGESVVQEGGALNLNCSVDSFPPSVVTWTKLSSNKTLNTETGTAELIISNMTAEDFGKYICTATQQITNLTPHTEVNAAMKPMILNSSACEVQSEVLTCVCISQAFPLPTIEWPLLENHTQYSFTSVSKKTVSIVAASVKDHIYSPVVCVSKNNLGEVKRNLTVIIKSVTESVSEKKETHPNQNLSEALKQPQVIVAFLIGLLVSAIICCSVTKCQRKKQTSSGNVSTENLEMMDAAGQTLDNGECHGQDRAECEAGAAVQPADVEPREVVYSDINFSLLKRRNPTEAENNQETTKSEYAEIWRDRKTEGRQENGGEDGEMLEGNKEEEVMMEEEERKDCVAEKEEEEDVALYSNVKDLMKKM